VATEVERKFLVGTIPDGTIPSRGRPIRQGYLAEDGDVEVRVRISGDSATVTVKAGRGLVRTEVEAAIALADAEALWAHTVGRRITKTRYLVDIPGADGLVAEVDEYADSLAGLLTAEVEFASEAAANTFVPPAWFGREVTAEPGWTNARLARYGRPS
jgi:adenylate cyclase